MCTRGHFSTALHQFLIAFTTPPPPTVIGIIQLWHFVCHQVAHISESPQASSAAAAAHKLCQLLVANIFGV